MAFEIEIVRAGNKGKLTFSHGGIVVNADCWWDSKVKIDAGIYYGAATRMTSKSDGSDGGKRQAIWLGNAVPYNNGTAKSDAIFIHKGKNASWSEGCIVAHEDQVVKIWNTVHPKEQANLKVTITDK